MWRKGGQKENRNVERRGEERGQKEIHRNQLRGIICLERQEEEKRKEK